MLRLTADQRHAAQRAEPELPGRSQHVGDRPLLLARGRDGRVEDWGTRAVGIRAEAQSRKEL